MHKEINRPARYLAIAWLLLAPYATMAEPPKVPAEKDLQALVFDSLLLFNKAVAAKNFGDFHERISTVWRKQITPKKLAEVFSTFLEQEIDLSPIATVDPIFTEPPKID